jgi:hypothetical protein
MGPGGEPKAIFPRRAIRSNPSRVIEKGRYNGRGHAREQTTRARSQENGAPKPPSECRSIVTGTSFGRIDQSDQAVSARRLAARSGVNVRAAFFNAAGCDGMGHCIFGRLCLGLHRVGLGPVFLVDRQQAARCFHIGRNQGEAETDVGLATKIPLNSASKRRKRSTQGGSTVFLGSATGQGTKVPLRGLFRRNGGDRVSNRPLGKSSGLRARNSGRRRPTAKKDSKKPALSLDRAGKRKRLHERGRTGPRERGDRPSAPRAGATCRPLPSLARVIVRFRSPKGWPRALSVALINSIQRTFPQCRRIRILAYPHIGTELCDRSTGSASVGLSFCAPARHSRPIVARAPQRPRTTRFTLRCIAKRRQRHGGWQCQSPISPSIRLGNPLGSLKPRSRLRSVSCSIWRTHESPPRS